MYQSIEDEGIADAQARPEWMRPVGIGLGVIGAGLLALALMDVSFSEDGAPISNPAARISDLRTDYLRALGETEPALRRARLTDVLTQHPDTPRDAAIRAQLAVLDAAADRDWQATLTTAYDPRVGLETRRAAVNAYQSKWGRYLGARDDEIAKLREDIETVPTLDTLPDRTLAPNPELYRGIPDDRLAGDRYGGESSVRFRSSEDLRDRDRRRARGDLPGYVPDDTRDLDGRIVGVRIVRNASPRYPRRAERRGEEAIVILSLSVDERGRVSDVDLIDVEADRYARDFVEAAERAAYRTRFEPRTIGGVPVETDGIRKRYRFELDGRRR